MPSVYHYQPEQKPIFVMQTRMISNIYCSLQWYIAFLIMENGKITFFSTGLVALGAVLGLTSGVLLFVFESFTTFVEAFNGFV